MKAEFKAAFLGRLAQKSTWAGLASLALVLGVDSGTFDLWVNVAVGLAGFALIIWNPKP